MLEGGGAYFEATGATLTDCTFTGNTVSGGNGGGANFFQTATLTNCTFTSNTANISGGGAYFSQTATLVGCTFTSNTSNVSLGGGAYFHSSATATLTGCTFMGNEARRGGGAYFNNIATLMGCTFMGNTANPTIGGGAYFDDRATLTNCTFMGNTATLNGGGAYFLKASQADKRCFCREHGDRKRRRAVSGRRRHGHQHDSLREHGDRKWRRAVPGKRRHGHQLNFLQQHGDSLGGGVLFTTTVARASILRNSILVGNMAKDATYGHQAYIFNMDVLLMNIQHNLIEDGATGETGGIRYQYGITAENTVNAAAAAVFASTTASEANYLRLKDGSPAISAGNNDYLNNGTPDNTEDDVTTDLAGNARIQGGTVDLGAYESDTKLAQVIAFTLATPGTVAKTRPHRHLRRQSGSDLRQFR